MTISLNRKPTCFPRVRNFSQVWPFGLRGVYADGVAPPRRCLLSCAPLPSDKANASETRSPPQRRKAYGWGASFRLAIGSKTGRSTSSKIMPPDSARVLTEGALAMRGRSGHAARSNIHAGTSSHRSAQTRSACSGKRRRLPYRSHRGSLPACRTRDAMNTAAPGNRYHGRSQALLYNTERPPASLGYKPPAPEVFIPFAARAVRNPDQLRRPRCPEAIHAIKFSVIKRHVSRGFSWTAYHEDNNVAC
jgi:hypothetical protein